MKPKLNEVWNVELWADKYVRLRARITKVEGAEVEVTPTASKGGFYSSRPYALRWPRDDHQFLGKVRAPAKKKAPARKAPARKAPAAKKARRARCVVTTAAGSRCKRPATPGGDRAMCAGHKLVAHLAEKGQADPAPKLLRPAPSRVPLPSRASRAATPAPGERWDVQTQGFVWLAEVIAMDPSGPLGGYARVVAVERGKPAGRPVVVLRDQMVRRVAK